MNASEAYNLATDVNVDDMTSLFDAIKQSAEDGEFKLIYTTSSKLNEYKSNMLKLNGYKVLELTVTHDGFEYEISWSEA